MRKMHIKSNVFVINFKNAPSMVLALNIHSKLHTNGPPWRKPKKKVLNWTVRAFPSLAESAFFILFFQKLITENYSSQNLSLNGFCTTFAYNILFRKSLTRPCRVNFFSFKGVELQKYFDCAFWKSLLGNSKNPWKTSTQ